MTFRTEYINKVLIDNKGFLRLPYDKQEALRRLTNQRGHALGEIYDLPSYITAVLNVFDTEQRTEVKRFFIRHLREGFTNSDKENLTPLLYDYDFSQEQCLVFLDMLVILTACEQRGLIDQIRENLIKIRFSTKK